MLVVTLIDKTWLVLKGNGETINNRLELSAKCMSIWCGPVSFYPGHFPALLVMKCYASRYISRRLIILQYNITILQYKNSWRVHSDSFRFNIGSDNEGMKICCSC